VRKLPEFGRAVYRSDPDSGPRRCEDVDGFVVTIRHATSFVPSVCVSALLKGHHQASLTRALKNARPMDFNDRTQLLRDIRDYAVEIRSVSVNQSACDRTLIRVAMAVWRGVWFPAGLGHARQRCGRISTARGNCYSECRKPLAPSKAVSRHAETVS